MGQSIAVAFCCIYISMLEIKCMNKYLSLKSDFHPPIYFKHFINDIFSIWKSKADAEYFIMEINNMPPNIKLTYSISPPSRIFLDVQVYKGTLFLQSRRIEIILYQNPINKYQYIPYCSFHTMFKFKSFINSELNRYEPAGFSQSTTSILSTPNQQRPLLYKSRYNPMHST